MTQKILVQLIDDLNGNLAEDGQAVSFALDGMTYEIGLREENAAKLRDSLADFVASARRMGGRAKRGAATATTRRMVAEARTKEQTKAIRDWARNNGRELADHGRILANIIEAFEPHTAGSREHRLLRRQLTATAP